MNYGGFFKMVDKVHKKTGKNRIFLFFDMVHCGLKYQAGYVDYDLFEMYGMNGVITIKTPRRITVRVFTILGQSVSQATLNPGTSELRIGTRGIYIVKIGNITQKVAL